MDGGGGYRVEAERWLTISEKLLNARDLQGAKTFAIRARESDPRLLHFADQIIAIADTLLAAEIRVKDHYGAATDTHDYYALLQLPRLTQSMELIATQYRKLALLLNPSRNRLAFADHSFRLVSDARMLFSNPSKKAMYDSLLQPVQLGLSAAQFANQGFVDHSQLPQSPVSSSSRMMSRDGSVEPITNQWVPVSTQSTRQSTQVEYQFTDTAATQHFLPQPTKPLAQQKQPPPPPPPQQHQPPPPPPPQPPTDPPRATPPVWISQSQPLDKPAAPKVAAESSRPAAPKVAAESSRPAAPKVAAESSIPAPPNVAAESSRPAAPNVVAESSRPAATSAPLATPPQPQQKPPEPSPPVQQKQKQQPVAAAVENQAQAQSQAQGPSFWTACPYCYVMYEYPKVYEECALKCQTCKRGFHAVKVPSPPVSGKDTYFCCWGFFPLGYSGGGMKFGLGGSNWSPFSAMFSTPLQPGGQMSSSATATAAAAAGKGKTIYKDDVYIEISDLSSDDDKSDSDDDDWDRTQKKLPKLPTNSNNKRPRGRPPSKNVKKSASSGEKARNNVVVDGKGEGGSSSGKKSKGGAKEMGKLDLNVMFSNEGDEASLPTGERNGSGHHGVEDNIEGISFFEGLDEFLSSLPILSVVGDDTNKVKAT